MGKELIKTTYYSHELDLQRISRAANLTFVQSLYHWESQLAVLILCSSINHFDMSLYTICFVERIDKLLMGV